MNFLKRHQSRLPIHAFFLFISGWWVGLQLTREPDDEVFLWFAAIYGLITAYGGILGLYYAKKWGMFRSFLGKTLVFLSISMLLTELGQLTFSYYNIFADVEIPYPSLADVGFFGAIPMYILGAYYLARTLNVKFGFKGSVWKLIVMTVIPLAMIATTALVYGHYYDASESSLLIVLLDYGYPVGQAITVSLAIIILLNVGRALGGIMRPRVFMLLGALFLQYIADLNFLLQGFNESWNNGGYGDYLYFVSYYVMVLALLSFRSIAPEKKEDV